MSRRYAAFLRGVTPMNLKMADLTSAFEAAGFSDVRTLLASGNVVFAARPATEAKIEAKAEAAMQKRLGKTFMTFVRAVDDLRALLEADPWRSPKLPAGSKRIVTFLRAVPSPAPALPVELDGARILSLRGREAYSAYVRSAKGPVFMKLLEKTFGRDVTTRTRETVEKATR